MSSLRLETARCILRPAEPSDFRALLSAVRSPLFPRRLPLAQMSSDDELSQWLVTMCRRTNERTAFLWSIDLKRDCVSCVGQVSFAPRDDSPGWNLAFWLHPGHWGQGIAQEAVSRAIGAAFESLDCPLLHAGAAHWNHASIRLLERLGFHVTGNNPAGYHVAQGVEPVHEFQLTVEEWRGRSSKA